MPVGPIVVGAVIPIVNAPHMVATITIPRPHVNYRTRVSIVIVRISPAVAVTIGITAVSISESDRETETDSHLDPGLTPRDCRESKRADRNRDQEKFLPVHDVSSVNVTDNLTRIETKGS